jgi:hypothetical protein
MREKDKYSLRVGIILLICFLCVNVNAQQASAKGDRYFSQNQFGEAIEFYKKDSRSRNKKVREHAMQGLADCYRITGNFQKAEEIYKKILSRNKKSPLAYLNYGLSLMSSAKYQDASAMFKDYLLLVPNDKMGTVYLQSCDSAQKWLDETIGREVRNIYEINTKESEFAPVTLENELLFLSSRKGSTRKLISFDGGGGITRLDFYTIGIHDITSGKKLIPLEDLNTTNHEGPACYSADGTEMFFTKTVKGPRDINTNQVVHTLQVFYRVKDKNGIWSEPLSAFPFNSFQYSVGHPAITPDGKRVYFMSDMPGGFGKTDIYYTEKTGDGTWGKPVNAGANINTVAHELFPAIGDDGLLYFSSNGHPGMGQLDIYRSVVEKGVAGQPQNLRPPVNSISNDFGISFFLGTARGFFSSDRLNGKGAEDVYAFAEIRPLEMVVAEETIILNDYSLFDNITYHVFDSAGVNEPTISRMPGKILATIRENGTYVVESTQYGLTINKVYLRFTKDRKEKSVNYSVLSTDKTIRISGVNFLGLHRKNAKTGRDPKKTYSNVKNSGFAELQMSIDETGQFSFKVELEPGRRHIINSMDVIGFEK